MDAVGSDQEDIHSTKQNKLSSMVLKLGLHKAYDFVNWTFLWLVQLQIGLSLKEINWIMSCVVYENFAVLINGGASKFFKASKGIR